MAEVMSDANDPHGIQSWRKLASVGVGIGAVLFGVFSGFWQIDSRLEQHGDALKSLAEAVKSLADKSATLDVVDAKIEHACLRMQLANQGRGWSCPFVHSEAKPSKKAAPAKKAPSPPAASWSLFAK